ncbi:DUF6167 family protein [Nocardioides piscis]|uniref:Secreted protein n=1 Tax=Nocardioides piscis TaxID=2714938 RepID=A0A6G7YJ30_9ACTN|nr:DUF6167 family protein [Nocardioides piscis]QIK76745.1 hypothetical protein G7071_16245 [Nocardioides piscis]
MARSLWFAAGAGAGVYAMSRARRAAEALTADGMRDRLSGLGTGLRLFREEVAAGQAEKEVELRQQLGMLPPGRHQRELTAGETASSNKEDTDGHQ